MKRKALLIAAAVFLILSLFLRGVFDNSDTAYYLSLMENKDFSHNTPHWGYTFLGTVFIGLLPFNHILVLNIMSAFFASAAVAYIFLLTKKLGFSESVSLLTSTVSFFTYTFFTSGFMAEVYIVQTAFLIASLYYWLSEKPLVSSVLFLAAMLVSPTSALVLPLFLLKRPKHMEWTAFATAFTIPYLVFLAFHYQNFLFGGRGILMGAENSDISRFPKAILKIIRDYNILLLFFPYGLRKLRLEKRNLIKKMWLMLLLTLPPLIFFVEYSTIILLIPFISLVPAYALSKVPKTKRRIILSAFILATTCLAALHLSSYSNLKELSTEIGPAPALPVVGNIHEAYLYKLYTGNQAYNSYGIISGIPFQKDGSEFSRYYLNESEFESVLRGGCIILDGKTAAIAAQRGFKMEKKVLHPRISLLSRIPYAGLKYEEYYLVLP